MSRPSASDATLKTSAPAASKCSAFRYVGVLGTDDPKRVLARRGNETRGCGNIKITAEHNTDRAIAPQGSGRRQVSSGSSSRTVRAPTRMASASARSICPRARAASLVTHAGLPSVLARQASVSAERELQLHERRCSVTRRICPSVTQRASSASSPVSTSMPCGAQARDPCSGRARVRVLDADHDTLHAGGYQRIGAGRRLADDGRRARG